MEPLDFLNEWDNQSSTRIEEQEPPMMSFLGPSSPVEPNMLPPRCLSLGLTSDVNVEVAATDPLYKDGSLSIFDVMNTADDLPMSSVPMSSPGVGVGVECEEDADATADDDESVPKDLLTPLSAVPDSTAVLPELSLRAQIPAMEMSMGLLPSAEHKAKKEEEEKEDRVEEPVSDDAQPARDDTVQQSPKVGRKRRQRTKPQRYGDMVDWAAVGDVTKESYSSRSEDAKRLSTTPRRRVKPELKRPLSSDSIPRGSSSATVDAIATELLENCCQMDLDSMVRQRALSRVQQISEAEAEVVAEKRRVRTLTSHMTAKERIALRKRRKLSQSRARRGVLKEVFDELQGLLPEVQPEAVAGGDSGVVGRGDVLEAAITHIHLLKTTMETLHKELCTITREGQEALDRPSCSSPPASLVSASDGHAVSLPSEFSSWPSAADTVVVPNTVPCV